MLDSIADTTVSSTEYTRLEALRKFDFLYGQENNFFDKLLLMMTQVFQTPTAYITLVDEKIVRYRTAVTPFGPYPTPRTDSICAKTIENSEPLIIEDTLADPSLAANRFVHAEEGIRFYAGAPLITSDGHHIGAVCVVDNKTRRMTEQQTAMLVSFSKMVMDEINLQYQSHQQAAIQKELAKAQAQLHATLEVGGITTWHWDVVNNKAYGGVDMARLFGISATKPVDGIPAEALLAAVHPDDSAYLNQQITKALREGSRYETEYRVFDIEGEQRWVLARGSAHFENGTPVSLTGSLIDITEKRKAESRLQAKNRELEFVTENLPQLVWATYGDGTVYYFNRQWFAYTGLPAEALMDGKWLSVLHPDDQQPTLKVWQSALNNRVVYEVEYRLRRYDGEYRWFLARGIPMKDETGAVLKWYGTTTDIHDQKRAEEDLKRFRYMADHAQDPFILMRKDGSFAYLNPKALQAWGYTHAEAKNLRVPDVDPIHKDDLFAELFDRVQNGDVPKVETLHRRKNGQVYLVEVNMGALQLEGEPYMFAVARDITERKATEEALKQSTERFDLVAKATQDAIWDWNLDTNDLWWNEGFKSLFHYRDEDIEKGIESWYNRIHPDDAERIVGGIHKVIDNGGKLWTDEYRFRKADGSYAIVLDRGYALHNAEGKPVRMLGSMQDITERKKYEETLRQSETRTRLAIQAASLGTFELNLTTNVFRHSDRSAKIFGFPAGEQIPINELISRIHPDDNKIRTAAHDMGRQTGSLFYEVRIIIPEKGIRWIRVNGTLITHDTTAWLIGTILDITEEKQAAELLEQKIQERTEELQAANDQLKQFSYAASHDLQEPLRKISIFTDRLISSLGHTVDEENLRLAARIQVTTNRMRMLINDLLDYSNTSMRNVNKEMVDLSQLVEEVVDDMETSVTETGTTLDIGKLSPLPGDKIQLRQLFQNLLSNAIKYQKPGTKPVVVVRAETVLGKKFSNHVSPLQQEKELYHLTVADNGIGFSPEYAERIFGLFQRLHGKAEYEGTGIGLAICKKVVENHHGVLWADSQPDVGTTFHILLPMA